jgi:hypothetical protein
MAKTQIKSLANVGLAVAVLASGQTLDFGITSHSPLPASVSVEDVVKMLKPVHEAGVMVAEGCIDCTNCNDCSHCNDCSVCNDCGNLPK